jgi:biopolymer transport protein ExbB
METGAAANPNLIHIFIQGGIVMYPLLAMAIAAIFFTINRFIAYGQYGSTSPGLTAEVTDMVAKGREGDALRRAEEGTGPVAATLAAILRNRGHAIDDIEREAEATGEDYFIKLEKFLPALDTFTTLSPLLGLLGTILGMVKVFQQFTAAANDENAKQRILAGVGESLYATAFGISIAVFCFAVYNYFTAKQRAVTIETQQAATRLIAQIHERHQAGH